MLESFAPVSIRRNQHSNCCFHFHYRFFCVCVYSSILCLASICLCGVQFYIVLHLFVLFFFIYLYEESSCFQAIFSSLPWSLELFCFVLFFTRLLHHNNTEYTGYSKKKLGKLHIFLPKNKHIEMCKYIRSYDVKLH